MLPATKTCPRCRAEKPLEDFPPMKSGKYGRYAYCRPCHAEYQASRVPAPKRKEINDRDSLRSQGLRKCNACGEIKPLDDGFYPSRHRNGRVTYGHCKTCLYARYRKDYLAREYGLTEEEFEALLDAQGGACAICQRPFGTTVRTNIDHSHRTHEVRAVLCVNCNTKVLPIVEYQTDVVRAALAYLADPPARRVLGDGRAVPMTNQARRRRRRRAA